MKLVNAEEVRQIFDYEVAQGATDLFDAFDSAIENATAVDAAPVVYGRWIKSESMVRSAKCSNCKGWITKHSVFEPDFKYCPNCGARMDGGSDNE